MISFDRRRSSGSFGNGGRLRAINVRGCLLKLYVAAASTLAALGTYGAVNVASAQDRFNRPMTFVLAGNGGNCDEDCQWTNATGVIEPDTPANFRKYIAANPYSGTVYFNSPGGNLIAGLKLGEAIRDKSLATNVGETYVYEGGPWKSIRQGICASACAYAFLGGTKRSLYEGSELGFHQFSADPSLKALDAVTNLEEIGLSRGQLITGLIAAYLVEMGIDARLLTIAAQATPDNVITLRRDDLMQFRVLTPIGWSAWKLEAVDRGITATSMNLDPDSLEQSIGIYCTDPGGQTYVALALKRYADFSREDFVKAITQVKLTIDGTAYALAKNHLTLAAEPHAYVLGLPLTAQAAESLTAGTAVKIAADSGHAFYDFGPSADVRLDQTSRNMIRLAFRNCL